MTGRHLLFFATSRWNLAHFRAGLMAALRADGYRTSAVVPEGEGDVGPDVPTFGIPLLASGTSPARELRSLLALIRALRSSKPDALVTFTPKANIYGGLAARACGIPFLPNVSGLGTGFLSSGWLRRVQTALYREAFRQAPTVFFQNREDSRLFTKMGLVNADQATVIPGSGVDCRHFTPAPYPERAPDQVELLFVGRLLGDKGIRELVEAIRLLRPRHPHLRLVLAGEAGADNHTAIQQPEVAEWEVEGLLRHAGKVEDVRPLIASSDAVILPSYREGMPRSLLEAAAMGRPLLASDVPGCRELVRDGHNGLLFAPRSATAIAETVERFLAASVKQRKAWGAAARAMVEQQFDERLVIDAYRRALVAMLPMSR